MYVESSGRRALGMDNTYWSMEGVKLTVYANPLDTSKTFHYKNQGNKLAKVSYQGTDIFIEPGESATFQVKDSDFIDRWHEYPVVASFNNGLP